MRRGLAALDETLAPQRAGLVRRAQQATVQAAERHSDVGPGRLLELLQAERPAMLERLCRETVERAAAAAVAVYRRAAGGSGRAGGRSGRAASGRGSQRLRRAPARVRPA